MRCSRFIPEAKKKRQVWMVDLKLIRESGGLNENAIG